MDSSNVNCSLPSFSQHAKLVPINYGTYPGNFQTPVYFPSSSLPHKLRDSRVFGPNTFQKMNPSDNFIFLFTPSPNYAPLEEPQVPSFLSDNSPIIPEIINPSISLLDPLTDKNKTKDKNSITFNRGIQEKESILKLKSQENLKQDEDSCKHVQSISAKKVNEFKKKFKNYTKELETRMKIQKDIILPSGTKEILQGNSNSPKKLQESFEQEVNSKISGSDTSIDIVNNTSVHLSISIEKGGGFNSETSPKSDVDKKTISEDSYPSETSSFTHLTEREIKKEYEDDDLFNSARSEKSFENSFTPQSTCETQPAGDAIIKKNDCIQDDSDDVQIVYEKIVMYVKRKKKHKHDKERKNKRKISTCVRQTQTDQPSDIHPIKLKKHHKGFHTVWSNAKAEEHQRNPGENNTIKTKEQSTITDPSPSHSDEKNREISVKKKQENSFKSSSNIRNSVKSIPDQNIRNRKCKRIQDGAEIERTYDDDDNNYDEYSSSPRQRSCKMQKTRRSLCTRENIRITRSLSAKLKKTSSNSNSFSDCIRIKK